VVKKLATIIINNVYLNTLLPFKPSQDLINNIYNLFGILNFIVEKANKVIPKLRIVFPIILLVKKTPSI